MTRAAKAAKHFSYAGLAKEADIQLAIRQVLTYMSIPHSLTDASRTWSEKGAVARPKVDQGWPDISAVVPWLPLRGTALFIECKAARTGFQPGQRECHAMLRQAGAIVIVPRSLEAFVTQMLANGIDHPMLRKMLPAARKVEPVEKTRIVQADQEPEFIEDL